MMIFEYYTTYQNQEGAILVDLPKIFGDFEFNFDSIILLK